MLRRQTDSRAPGPACPGETGGRRAAEIRLQQDGLVAGGIFMGDDIRRACLQRLRHIGVSVEILALQGNENLSGPERPGIRIHAFRGEEKSI